MNIEVWISFVLASSLLCFTPGPTVFLVMGQSLSQGKKSVLPLVSGVMLGDVVAMSVSFAGLGALLATSASLFNLFKWVAALYLIYIGVKAWKAKTTLDEDVPQSSRRGKVFIDAFIVTALNPKGIIFFIAFFPLFINTNQSITSQMMVLGFTFLSVSALSASFYATFAGFLRSKVKSPVFQNVFNKISGSMLAGAGVLTASIQKSS